MSQTTPENTFLETCAEGWNELRKRGLRGGPEYQDNESAPLVWYDQVFQREIEPAGAVACEKALLVGATQNGLDVILVGSHSNAGDIVIPAGATITLKTLISEDPAGPFVANGPSLCATSPAGGIKCGPDQLAIRFAIGNFKKQWLKISLEFSGEIGGGKVDAALSLAAR